MNKILITTIATAKQVLQQMQDNEILKIYPQDNLQVCITKTGYREYWNGEIGAIGDNPENEIVRTLYKYRKAYNAEKYKVERG